MPLVATCCSTAANTEDLAQFPISLRAGDYTTPTLVEVKIILYIFLIFCMTVPNKHFFLKFRVGYWDSHGYGSNVPTYMPS